MAHRRAHVVRLLERGHGSIQVASAQLHLGPSHLLQPLVRHANKPGDKFNAHEAPSVLQSRGSCCATPGERVEHHVARLTNGASTGASVAMLCKTLTTDTATQAQLNVCHLVFMPTRHRVIPSRLASDLSPIASRIWRRAFGSVSRLELRV